MAGSDVPDRPPSDGRSYAYPTAAEVEESARASDRPARERFRHFSAAAARTLGSAWAFLAAAAFTVLWAVAGPVFRFSDTWQLTMNTVATVVAFLMVFVIQNTQNRDTRAMQLKLDELIRAIDGTRKDLVRLEDLPDGDLKRLGEEFRAIGLGRYREPPPDDGGAPGGEAEPDGRGRRGPRGGADASTGA